ncbi:MAG TPA: RNA methyltransferase [Bacteroidota bacterium]|nr:RNA methyltransferase [Bacteroidota bacterium]
MISRPKLQYLKNLSQKKHRENEGVFVVEGWRAVEEVCAALNEIEILVCTKDAGSNQRFASVLRAAKKKSNEVLEASPKEFNLVADTVTGQGIAAVVKKQPLNARDAVEKILHRDRAFVVALDQISDPGNLGAIVRTSDWFGVDAVLLSPNCVEPYNPKVVRSTVGSIFHLPLIDCSDDAGLFADILTTMKKSGFTIVGAEVAGNVDVRSFLWPKKAVLVVGNEARGISPEMLKILDTHVSIPKFGRAESLNAGAAAGILLSHHAFQQKD